MHTRLILWSVTAALAGFLFGFDTIVISGAEQTFQRLWQLDKGMHGLATGMALWGTVIGAIFGGIPSERYGRRKTLIGVGVLYFVSALGSGVAPDVFPFMIGAVGPGFMFGFFCFMMVLQLLWVRFMVPETKNIPLEALAKKLGLEGD